MRTARTATLILASLTLLVVGCSGGSSGGSTVTSTAAAHFKTPEQAITTYLDGIAHSDLDKVLSACALDELSKGFKFDLYTQNLGGAQLPLTLAPTAGPFYVEMNRYQVTSQICVQVKCLTYGLLTLSSDEADNLGTFMLMDANRISSFTKDLDLNRLTGLKVVQTGSPSIGGADTAKAQGIMTRNAAALGADEETERAVLLSFEGNDYSVGFTLLRYGDGWKVYQQRSSLLNTDPYGLPHKTTVQDFQSLLQGS